MSQSTEIALVGPFQPQQEQTISTALVQLAMPQRVKIYPNEKHVSEGALVAVRGGVTINRPDFPLVISGGSGVGNITPAEGRQIENCAGANGPETAAHGMGLLILELVEHTDVENTNDTRLVIIGAGHVGVNAAILARELGIDVVLVQRQSKDIPVGMESMLTTELEQAICWANAILIAANGKDVLTEKHLPALSQADQKVIVNMARAHAISPELLNQLRAPGSNIRYATDVWYEEPKEGEYAPQSMRQQLQGIDGAVNISGTMHQGAQQESSNLRVAEMLAAKFLAHLRGEFMPGSLDPLEILPQGWSEKGANLELAKLLESSDVRRVRHLKKSLIDWVGICMQRQIPWQQPATIPPITHDFVKLIQDRKIQ